MNAFTKSKLDPYLSMISYNDLKSSYCYGITIGLEDDDDDIIE